MDKASHKPCPGCNMPLPRQSFRKLTWKCEACSCIVCDNCSFGFFCIDCYSKTFIKEEIELYKADPGRLLA